MHLYSGLVDLDDDLMVEPDIAREWSVSDDGTRYVFHLGDDVRFHSADRSRQPISSTPGRGRAVPRPVHGRPRCTSETSLARDVLEGRTSELRGVTVLDEYTLQVDIEAPRAYFIDKLTYPTAYVVDREAVARGAEWWREPNGTGPFMLSRWERGTLLELRRNPDYWNAAPGGCGAVPSSSPGCRCPCMSAARSTSSRFRVPTSIRPRTRPTPCIWNWSPLPNSASTTSASM